METWLSRRSLGGGLCAAAAFPTLSRAQKADAVQALYEGARKEGKVVYFTSNDVEVSRESAKAFAKKFPGVEVEAYKIEPGPAMERIIGESGAGRLSCDVTDGPVAYTQLLFDRGLALSYPWADVFGIDPGDVLFEGRALYAYNLDCPIAYNTNLVQPGEIKSWEELTAPKWSGKVLLEARGIVFPLLALAWGEDKAFDYLKRLVANKPLIIKGGTQTLESLAGGQGAVAVGGYGGRVEQFKDEGAPVEWARVSPVPAMIYTHMALKGAPHPNAALLWNAWSIGKEHLDALYARQRNGRLSGSKISPLGQKMKGAGLEIVYETGNAAEMQTLLVRAGAAIGGLK